MPKRKAIIPQAPFSTAPGNHQSTLSHPVPPILMFNCEKSESLYFFILSYTNFHEIMVLLCAMFSNMFYIQLINGED